MRALRPATQLGLSALVACGGGERNQKESGKPEVAAAQISQPPSSPRTGTGCDTIRGASDVDDYLSRTESHAWARPDQPRGTGCVLSNEPNSSSQSVVTSSDTAHPDLASGTNVPLTPGLVFVSVYRYPKGDREDVVRVTDVSSDGVTYQWQYTLHPESGPPREDTWDRFVRAADLASSPRLNTYFVGQGRSDTPGYTTFVLSRATYAQLRDTRSAPYRIVMLQGAPFKGAMADLMKGGPLEGELANAFESRVTVKGTLSVVSPAPEPMPVLLNGRRVSVPALHLKGRFAYQEAQSEYDFWVLADSLHPLLLRVFIEPDTFQVVKIQVPEGNPSKQIERELEAACRVELPGVYFDFASAEMQSASIPALAGVAELLQRHPDWTFTIEGHTDSIGDPASNQTLSQKRAEAVKTKLVALHRISPDRLRPVGFGASRPRESNNSIEGRARNRRVELVREC